MYRAPNFNHKFKLNGLKTGDWFMGCEKCWYQRPKNEAGFTDCPKCHNRLTVHKFTEADKEIMQ